MHEKVGLSNRMRGRKAPTCRYYLQRKKVENHGKNKQWGNVIKETTKKAWGVRFIGVRGTPIREDEPLQSATRH